MKLLVTNDDGVVSPGLWALADGLRDAGHDVVVVAPADERSGSGAAIGHIIPGQGVAVSPVARPGWEGAAWAVDGAPALCVLLALRLGAFGADFEAVVSGVNPGWNTGHGVIHSGTVGAVMAGGNSGLPGVAVSIDGATAQIGQVGLVPGVPEHWPSAVALAASAVGWLAGTTLTAGTVPTMLNLNVPNRPLDGVLGVRAARLGRSAASGLRQQRVDIGFDGQLRLELGPPEIDVRPGTDNALLADGFATVTVLTGIGDAPGGCEVVETMAALVGDGVFTR